MGVDLRKIHNDRHLFGMKNRMSNKKVFLTSSLNVFNRSQIQKKSEYSISRLNDLHRDNPPMLAIYGNASVGVNYINVAISVTF